MSAVGEVWRDRAACRNTPVEWWDADERRGALDDRARAVVTCWSCPVLQECRQWVDDWEASKPGRDLVGIVAGEMPWERTKRRGVQRRMPGARAVPFSRCVTCGRVGRDKRVSAKAAPGYVVMDSPQECSPCARRRERRAARDAARRSMVQGVCPECGRVVRARNVAARVVPGSVPAGAKGMCQRCYKRSRRQGAVRDLAVAS